MTVTGFKLKQDMLLGAAAAATQIEGGELAHSWNAWADRDKIRDGSTPRKADDHWRLWREDAALMQVMGLQIYRLGIEWARVEPEEGDFDDAVIKRYVDEINLLLCYNIKPLVTLHHFTNPMWFERKGAFEKIANLRYFLRFAEKMVRAFGDRVSEYITLNEPNVYAMLGYFTAEWPPGRRNFFKMNKVVSVMATGHIYAYEMIHRVRAEMGLADTKVGFAHHMRSFSPASAQSTGNARRKDISGQLELCGAAR